MIQKHDMDMHGGIPGSVYGMTLVGLSRSIGMERSQASIKHRNE
jgi:hypothetical protein